MPKYKAYATLSYDLSCEFEIEAGQDPWDVAKELDGGIFREIDGSGSWKVFEIEGLQNE